MSELTRDLASQCQMVEEASSELVIQDPFTQALHLMPPVGWLNDPNGLCQFQGVFHAYFQYAPFDVHGGVKLWGHSTSLDLVHWDYDRAVLFPDTPYDCDGVYSGCCLVHDDAMHMYYTGNVTYEGNFDLVHQGREGNTVLVSTVDGTNFSPKMRLLTNRDYPADDTCHVRDPKVWEQGGRFYMVLGARRNDDHGECLILESDDMVDWHLRSRTSTEETLGYMWECPDYIRLTSPDGTPFNILALSIQQFPTDAPAFASRDRSGYLRVEGDLLGEHRLRDFRLVDAGFDYYAPQSFVDEKGRTIAIAWMGRPHCPETTNPTITFGWQGCFTLPRVLTTDGARLLQAPVEELDGFRKDLCETEGCLNMEVPPVFDLVMDGIGEEFSAVIDEELTLSLVDGELIMKFSDVSLGAVGAGRDERRAQVGELRNMRIVGDFSSVEVFANDGEHCMTTRYYPHSYHLSVDAPGSRIRLYELDV